MVFGVWRWMPGKSAADRRAWWRRLVDDAVILPDSYPVIEQTQIPMSPIEDMN
jgi:hypothetical protein